MRKKKQYLRTGFLIYMLLIGGKNIFVNGSTAEATSLADKEGTSSGSIERYQDSETSKLLEKLRRHKTPDGVEELKKFNSFDYSSIDRYGEEETGKYVFIKDIPNILPHVAEKRLIRSVKIKDSCEVYGNITTTFCIEIGENKKHVICLINHLDEEANKENEKAIEAAKIAIDNSIDIAKITDYIYTVIDSLVLSSCAKIIELGYKEEESSVTIEKRVVNENIYAKNSIYAAIIDIRNIEASELDMNLPEKEMKELIEADVTNEKKGYTREKSLAVDGGNLEVLFWLDTIHKYLTNKPPLSKMIEDMEGHREMVKLVLERTVKGLVDVNHSKYEDHSKNIKNIISKFISKNTIYSEMIADFKEPYERSKIKGVVSRKAERLSKDLLEPIERYISDFSDLKYAETKETSVKKIRKIVELAVHIFIELHKNILMKGINIKKMQVEEKLNAENLEELLAPVRDLKHTRIFAPLLQVIDLSFSTSRGKIEIKEGLNSFLTINHLYKEIFWLKVAVEVKKNIQESDEIWENPVFYHCSIFSYEEPAPKPKAFIIFKGEDKKLYKKKVSNNTEKLNKFLSSKNIEEIESVSKSKSKEILLSDMINPPKVQERSRCIIT